MPAAVLAAVSAWVLVDRFGPAQPADAG